MIAVPLLTDDEIRPCMPPIDDSGFGALRTAKGNMPLYDVGVSARLTGLFAEVQLRQTFGNPHAEPLEATYLFPLPDRGALTAFRFEVNGRAIDGVLKERGQAREDYDRAIQTGHRAAIAEEERPGTFTMRVGNLMPGERATVQLTLTVPLTVVDGEATFRFPLVVAPRYIPGAALGGENVGSGPAMDTDAVPDASRITAPVLLPGFPNPVRLSIEVELDSLGLPMGEVRSSLHAIVEEGRGWQRKVRVQPGERLNRDFILRFPVAGDAVATGLAVIPDQEGGGVFSLTVMPPAASARAVKPRDVIFIVDRSGSMSGWKMVSARRAVARMVDSLTDHDRFNVYAFDDRIETPPELGGEGLAQATDRNRFRSVEFLAKVDARGGTELAHPLQRAVSTLSATTRDRVLVLVTDGQVGNEDQILRSLQSSLNGIRIFTVGVDTAVNEAFLRRFAAQGGGTMELVESEDRLDAVMDRIHRRIASPVLTQVRMETDAGHIDAEFLQPARVPDLFPGTPLVIAGRYTGAPPTAFRVSATTDAGLPFTVQVPATQTQNKAVVATWARGLLRQMEDRYVVQGSPDLENKIVAVSLRYGVMCRFTSFVAVDRAQVVNPGGQQLHVNQALEKPQGWNMSVGGAVPPTLPGGPMGQPFPGQARGGMASPSAASARPATGAAAPPMSKSSMPAPRPASPARMSAPMAPPPAASFDLAEDSMAAHEDEGQYEEAEADAPSLLGRVASAGADLFRRKDAGEAEKKREAPPVPVRPQARLPAPPPPAVNRPAMPSMAQPAPQQAQTPSGLNLQPYRVRAQELVAKLAAGHPAGRLALLGTTVLKLQELVEDLKSVGAPAAEVQGLEALLHRLTALRDAAGGGEPSPFESDVQALVAFAQGSGAPAPTLPDEPARKRGFWK
jgi:Ca-activated chloride channel family protein